MHVLNLTYMELGSVDVLASSCVLTTIPSSRALGGRFERNSRAGFAPAEKGLNLVVTSVMNRVNILGSSDGRKGGRNCWRGAAVEISAVVLVLQKFDIYT